MGTEYLNGRRADPNYTVGTITLEDGITSIAEKQFQFCYNLEEIFFVKNLTSIEKYAFVYCYGLKKITYHKKIEDLLKKCFGKKQWDSVKKIVIED